MLTTYTQSNEEIELKEPGFGGLPPEDDFPTGGGGDDDDWNTGGDGPRQLLYRFRRFLFTAIAVDLMFFGVLTSVFLGHQSGMHLAQIASAHPVRFHVLLLPHILYLNTLAIILGSYCIERARRNIFREIDVLEEWLGLGFPALRRTLPWVAATLFCGAVFLTGQKMAWRQVTTEGFAFDLSSSTAGNLFFLITSTHAIHLAVGVTALLLCLTALSWLKRIELRQIAIDATAWYWHSLSLIWLFSLTLLAVARP
jgi:cytochrome c oxidase subunit 3